MAWSHATEAGLFRRLLLAILVFGIVGIGVELLLLAHYEDTWQVVPLLLLAASLVVIGLHLKVRGSGPGRALQILMGLFIVSGLVGVALHYRGNLQFQLEIDVTQSSWEMFKKVVRAKTPPALAPGVMTQLGLIGLLYAYRHPALDSSGASHD